MSSSLIRRPHKGRKRYPNQSNDARMPTERVARHWIGMDVPPSFIPIGNSTKVYQLTQGFGESTFIQTSAFTVSSAMFQFSNLPQASSFGQLFDQYRIDAVELTFRPRYTVGLSGLVTPLLYTVIDYDDVATPTATVAFFQQYENCVTSQYETVVRCWKPHVAMAALDNTGYSSNANVPAPWLDMANSSVEHFGIKWGCDAGSGTFQSWTVSYRAMISLRNVR